MEKEQFYRPPYIEFNVATDETKMPESFGTFEDEEKLSKFLGNLVSVNQSITVSRHMDFKEKTELRATYNDVLENKLPLCERELSHATQIFEDAKKKLSDAKSTVDAAIIEAKLMAAEVKRGLKEMNLDEKYTHRVAFRGRYYFYTWIDKSFRLCYIKDIPEHEKTELWNAMSVNENFIENGEITAQDGKEK